MPRELYKPGQSGNPAGRPKGSKNKLNYCVNEICEREECNPFEVLAQIAMGKVKDGDGFIDIKKSIRLRMEAAAELAQYLAPKLKAIEISSDPQNPIQVTMNFGHANPIQRN